MSPNQLTEKFRADDMSQPISGVTMIKPYNAQCEMRAPTRCHCGVEAGTSGMGLNQRQIRRNTARPNKVMPIDL